MGTYSDVSVVKTYGKRIYSKPSYVRGQLIAICDNGMFELAVDVSNQDQYDHFYEQYSRGMLLSMDLYDYTPGKGETT